MPVLFSDGFESPPNTPPDTFGGWSGKQNSPTIIANGQHSGSYEMKCDANQTFVFQNLSSQISLPLHVRTWVKLDNAPINNLDGLYPLQIGANTGVLCNCEVVWYVATGWHLIINGMSGGVFTNVLDDTIIPDVTIGEWQYIELKGLVDAVAGQIEAWWNGTKYCTFTGDTTGVGWTDQIYVGNVFTTGNMDDKFDDVVASNEYIGIGEPMTGIITGYATIM